MELVRLAAEIGALCGAASDASAVEHALQTVADAVTADAAMLLSWAVDAPDGASSAGGCQPVITSASRA